MTTPAQPAPVTPPPEWAVKAAKEAHPEYAQSNLALHRMKHTAAIIARHAPPPAPSCPTEQGELASLLKQMLDVAENCDETGYVDGEGFVNLDKLHDKVRAAIAATTAKEGKNL